MQEVPFDDVTGGNCILSQTKLPDAPQQSKAIVDKPYSVCAKIV